MSNIPNTFYGGAGHSTIRLKGKFSSLPYLFVMGSIAINAAIFTILIYGSFNSMTYDMYLLAFFVAYNLSVSIVIVGALVFRFVIWLTKNKNLSMILYGACILQFFSWLQTSALATILFEIEARSPPVSPIPNPWDKTATRTARYSPKCTDLVPWRCSD